MIFLQKKNKVNSKKKKVNFAANDDLLLKDETFDFIEKLADFWCDPKKYLSADAQKYFDILNIYQNKLWQMVVSMCFYKENPSPNTDNTSNIFDTVLPQLVSYCALGLVHGKGGISGLFWGLMKANIHIKDNKTKIFEPSKNIPELCMPSLENFTLFCNKALTKHIRYLLAIDTLIYNSSQPWEWDLKGKHYNVVTGQIEHILPKKWKESNYEGWNERDAKHFLEYIGNKALIEQPYNITAGNGYFNKKKEHYIQSNFLEIKSLGSNNKKQWLKDDIQDRNKEIYERLRNFIETSLQEKN